MFHFTPYLFPLILSALALCVLGLLVWRQRRNSASLFMFAVVVCLEIWVIGFILEIAADELETKIVLANLQFIGIDLLPVAWLALTLTYTGHLRTWGHLVRGLVGIPILNQLIIWTNPWHHLFRSNPTIDLTTAPFPILVNDYSYWYYCVQLLFVNFIFLFTVVLLINTLRTSVGTHRKQILFMLLSTLLPILLNGLYVMNLSPIPHFNLSAVGFTLSGVILTWSLLRYRFLDLMPVARTVLVDRLKDAWMVLDYASRFVDLNQTAENIIGQPKHKIYGRSASEVLAQRPELIAFFQTETESHKEVCLNEPAGLRYYDLSLTPIQGETGEAQGRLVIMRDVTSRVESEQERERLIGELQGALAEVKVLAGLLPICANCKNVRDDDGYWHRVEKFLEQHSEVKFSHGICPSCAKHLFPEFADKLLEEPSFNN